MSCYARIYRVKSILKIFSVKKFSVLHTLPEIRQLARNFFFLLMPELLQVAIFLTKLGGINLELMNGLAEDVFNLTK